MSKFKQGLESIAESYHLNSNISDMYLENKIQMYESNWIKSKLILDILTLDLGYGDGVIYKDLHKSFLLEIIEGSSKLVEEAKDEFLRNNDSKTRIYESLFEEFDSNKKYKQVICSHVLEHVEEPRLLLKHLNNLMLENGVIVGIVPNSNSIHRQLGVSMGLSSSNDALSERDKVVGHLRVYDFQALENDLKETGFTLIEARGFFVKPLSNSQIIKLEPEVIQGLLNLSDVFPKELCANIGFVAGKIR
jgi:2-polyprenyl-3-methyl-5-hydroxy-6-metoxy-1,4-benzoquinol methylase